MNYLTQKAQKRKVKSDAARKRRKDKKNILVERTLNLYRKLRKARK